MFPRRHENPINTVPWSETVLPKQERKKKKKKKHQPNNPINVTRTSTPILFYHPSPKSSIFEIGIISDCERQGWLNASEFLFHRRLIPTEKAAASSRSSNEREYAKKIRNPCRAERRRLAIDTLAPLVE